MSWKCVLLALLALPLMLLHEGPAFAKKKKAAESGGKAHVATPTGDGRAQVSESSKREAEKRIASYYNVVKKK